MRFIQSNLQRSKLATTELLVEAKRRKITVALVQETYIGNIGELRRYPGCKVVQKTTPRRGPVKAAIIILNSDIDSEEDQTLNDGNVAAAVIKAENCRIGVVSVYFEGDMPIGPYLDRVRYVCAKLGTDKIILRSDVNAWSVWWGSERNDARGVDLCDFLDSEELHILNKGNTPTFEVYRGDRLLKSVVDMTACSSALLDRAKGWQARWSEFRTAIDVALDERTLTVEIVKSVGSCDQLNDVVETYTECIRQACVTAIPRKRSKTRGLKPPWWSPELEKLKRDARIAEAQTTSWKRFCSAQDGESLWDGIYRVIRKTGKNRKDVLLKTDSEQVLGPDESATLLAETFFPDDRVDTDDSCHTEVRRRTDGGSQPPETSGDLPGADPPFTGTEIKNALKAFHPRKAPGIDGFTSDICQAAIFCDLGLFLAMANKYLELGYFPRAWKVAAIKVIPKPGKEDYVRPNSYRPIVAGVGDPAARSKLSGKPSWHGSRLSSGPRGCRQVHWRGVQEKDFERLYTGLYSRSNLLEPDSGFPTPRTRGTRRIRAGVCGPVVPVFSGQSASSIEEEANRALDRVHCWGVRNKLRFATLKTNSMVLTKKLKYDDPVVHMNGEQISSVGEIRLLGLTIDKKLKFIPHVAKACKKAAKIYKGLTRAAKAMWGLSSEVVRTIYITVIEPIVLYASCAWAPATKKLGVRKMLDAVQRSVALKACRAHRTVSLHSALILSMLLPLDIKMREAAWLYEVKRGKDLGDTFVDRELEIPVYFGDLLHPAHEPDIGYESIEDLDLDTWMI
ncbi:Putative 115 kDa protein in type-1 retrotransposable element R1DM [Eumeta japonica]|uniref:115 kDa protein in type-1 retrotransposable element R1DM n=1 Tax=Eumeta variegata TaxID=151549 RepID=A0A4C1UJ65_EUMVA|nr:Putative 115 kDa protein in type-1 retrotransposable element R1DM [Eumeta japonica]